MDGEHDLAHTQSAEPLDSTTHLACGGQALRAQGVVGLSERNKGSRKRLRTEKRKRNRRKAAVDLCKPKSKKTKIKVPLSAN